MRKRKKMFPERFVVFPSRMPPASIWEVHMQINKSYLNIPEPGDINKPSLGSKTKDLNQQNLRLLLILSDPFPYMLLFLRASVLVVS